jgi:hypothetical protein
VAEDFIPWWFRPLMREIHALCVRITHLSRWRSTCIADFLGFAEPPEVAQNMRMLYRACGSDVFGIAVLVLV